MPSEIEDYTSTDKKAQARGLRKLGIEVANLLVYLIDTLELPQAPTPGTSKINGGISVLGWSLGAHLPIALLSSASSLPSNIQEILGKYLRSAVLFGRPSHIFLIFS